MTVTLGGNTLTCKQLTESCDVVATQWDAWVSSAFKRKVKAYGVVRVWTLRCVENNVAWASSVVNSFETSEAAGTALAFTVDDQVRVVSTNVYVMGVTIDCTNLAGKNIRYFTLTLQEA